MMVDADIICEKENLDASILLPLAILHDVGYAEVSNKDNPFQLDIRRAHMKAGSDIAERILKEIGYPEEKIRIIADYIAVHDNWAFGEHDRYINDVLLGTFNDLDYMWMATKKGFDSAMVMLKKTPEEMLRYLKDNEKPVNRPFSTETTKELYANYLKDREAEVNDSK